MGFRGQTYRVDFQKGGFNYNANLDAVSPTDMIYCKNIKLLTGGRESRGGTSKVNSTAFSGGPRLMGAFDFQLATTSFHVVGGKDGKLYKNSTATIKTGMSTANFYSFDVFGNELYVCDGDTTPQTWDGSAAGTSDLTTPSADWSGSNQPFQCIAHGYGTSRRMWYLYSNKVYYSSLNNGKEVSGGTSGYIAIETGDATGLVGGIEYGDRLIVFGKNKAFIIDDSSIDTANWGYSVAQWDGGAAHWRLLVKTPNDLVAMTEDGNIYSVTAAQSYGDYKQASLTRPAFVDVWIKENVRLSYIADFNSVYDPTDRCIYFFVVRNGETEPDTALVYYIDRPAEDAWSIHDNTEYASGFNASCSSVVRVSTGVYKIYTGDGAGFVWKLGETAKNDNGDSYYAGFKTPYLNLDDARTSKLFRRILATVKTSGNFNISVRYYIDGQYGGSGTVELTTTGGIFDTGKFDEATFVQADPIEGKMDIGATGKRIQVEFYNNEVNEDFFISAMLLDFTQLGRRPS